MIKFVPFHAIALGFLLLPLAATGLDTTMCPCLSLEEKVGMANGIYTFGLTEVPRLNMTQDYLDQYGVGCAKHSEENKNEWCYIDPTNCHLNFSPSDLFYSLFYSFAACGYPNEYQASTEQLRSQDLKVVVHQNYRGYQGTICPTDRECYGTLIDAFAEITYLNPDLNITWVEAEVPQWITERAANYTPFLEDGENPSHGACVYATSLGVVDMCLGAFTMNANRGLLTSFIEMGVTTEYLVVLTDLDQQNVIRMFWNAFKPFSGPLWVTTFVVMIALTSLFFIQEYSWTQLKGSPLDQTAGLAIYDAFLGFFGQGYEIGDEPRTWGGRFTLLAIAVQILLGGAAYTANLTNFLVRDGFSSSVNSIDDAIKQEVDVCVLRNRIPILDNSYGEGNIKYAINPEDGLPGFENRPELLSSMHGGLCECAIVGLEQINEAHGDGEFCDINIVGTPVMEMPWGIPVSDKFARPMRTVFSEYIQTGGWNRVQKAAKPVNQCPEQVIDHETTRLKPSHMFGAYAVSFSLAMIGILFSLSSAITRRRRGSIVQKSIKMTSTEMHQRMASKDIGDLELEKNTKDPNDNSNDNLKQEMLQMKAEIMSRMKTDVIFNLREEIAELKQLIISERDKQD